MKIAHSKFVALLTDHQEIIRSFIITQIPGSPDVRDILQEVNIVLWEKKGSFKEGTNFGAWACTIARYKVLEHRRKEARHAGLFLFNDELSEFLGEKFQNHPPNFLEEHRQALEHCLPQLSEKNRQLLSARYSSNKGGLEKYSQETGRSNESLRVTLFRLRDTLRRCIKSYLSTKASLS